MANCYPKRFCSALTCVSKGVVLNAEDVVLCISGVSKLPAIFYLYYGLDTITNATDTMPVYISTPNGNVPLLSPTLSAITYAELVAGTVLSIAKVNICSTCTNCNSCDTCCYNNNQITYFQVIGYNTPTATTTVTP